MLCAYLSVAVLAGLAANVLAGWCWADPAMALQVSVVVVVQTGVRTLRSRDLASCRSSPVALA